MKEEEEGRREARLVWRQTRKAGRGLGLRACGDLGGGEGGIGGGK